MKRTAALLLSLVLAAGCLAVPASAAGFADVDPEQYYYEPVRWAAEEGLVNGMTPTAFEPEGLCTRGQIVTILWRQAGKPQAKNSSGPFTDVREGDYFYPAVLWAAEKGLVNGMTPTAFEPESPCTRGQFVTLLWRMNGRPQAARGFLDYFEDVPRELYYYSAVCWAAETGVAGGVTAAAFDPEAPCTRGQVVTLLYRARDDSRNPAQYVEETITEQGSGESFSYDYHMPQLKAESEDAEAINREIDGYFGSAIRAGMEAAGQGLTAEPYSVDWRCHRYEDILVLLVRACYGGDCEDYRVYCLDLTDETRVTGEELLEMYGLTKEAFAAGAEKTAEAAFYRYNPEESCSWSGPEFEESLRWTLSDERINENLPVYPARNGALMLLLDVGNIVAGASSVRHFCAFQAA